MTHNTMDFYQKTCTGQALVQKASVITVKDIQHDFSWSRNSHTQTTLAKGTSAQLKKKKGCYSPLTVHKMFPKMKSAFPSLKDPPVASVQTPKKQKQKKKYKIQQNHAGTKR